VAYSAIRSFIGLATAVDKTLAFVVGDKRIPHTPVPLAYPPVPPVLVYAEYGKGYGEPVVHPVNPVVTEDIHRAAVVVVETERRAFPLGEARYHEHTVVAVQAALGNAHGSESKLLRPSDSEIEFRVVMTERGGSGNQLGVAHRLDVVVAEVAGTVSVVIEVVFAYKVVVLRRVGYEQVFPHFFVEASSCGVVKLGLYCVELLGHGFSVLVLVGFQYKGIHNAFLSSLMHIM
jgi:hypothetical protein